VSSRAVRFGFRAAALTFALIAAFAVVEAQAAVVPLPRLSAETHESRFGGRSVLVVRSMLVRRVHGSLSVRCNRCRRLVGRIRVSRPSATSKRFSGVNWILRGSRAVKVTVVRRDQIGRYLLLTAQRRKGRLGLAYKESGCLDGRRDRLLCPRGTPQPRMNEAVVPLTPQPQPQTGQPVPSTPPPPPPTTPVAPAPKAGTSPSISSAGTVAFQANTSNLWTVGPGGRNDWRLGMMSGTSPSIAALKGGGYQVAFQANTGNLWTVGSAGNKDWGLGMRAGTSPSIAATPDGQFVVAFQANTSNLWTVGSGGKGDWHLGMMSGTSPSVSSAGTVAFQANTSNLWTVGPGGKSDWHLGMMSGTSPSISSAGAVAFQANTSSLWTVGPGGRDDWHLGMMSGTSPSVSSAGTVAFQANTSSLWTVGPGGRDDWHLGMM